MAAIVDDEKWRRFFQTYKSLPEIWKVNSDGYKNRDKRSNGWRKLLDVYRRIDKNATMDNLKHRVNNIRSCYRRELRKIQLNDRKYGPDAVHMPTLWYFRLLDHIRDQETHLKNSRDSANDFIFDDFDDIPILSEPEIDDPKPQPKRLKLKKRKMTHHRDDKDKDEQPEKRIYHDISKDEASIYADGWACSYRKLTIEQQLYAKKAIEEVLILGQLNALNLKTVDSTSSLKVISIPEFEETFDPDDNHIYNEEEMNN